MQRCLSRGQISSGKECTWRHLESEEADLVLKTAAFAVTGKGSSRAAGRGEVVLEKLLKQECQGSFNRAEWGKTVFAEGWTGQQQR